MSICTENLAQLSLNNIISHIKTIPKKQVSKTSLTFWHKSRHYLQYTTATNFPVVNIRINLQIGC